MLMSIVNVCLFFLFKLVNLKMVLHNKSFMHRTSCSQLKVKTHLCLCLLDFCYSSAVSNMCRSILIS